MITAVNNQPNCSFTENPWENHPIASEKITTLFYKNEVPFFISGEIERLYRSIYTTIARLEIYDEMRNASTFVASQGGEIIAVVLFRLERNKVTVLNKQIKLQEQEINRFAKAIFSEFKSVTVISFSAIETDISKFKLSYQCCRSLSDIVVKLPGTENEYFSSLGKSLRRTIRSYLGKIKRDIPTFQIKVYEKGEVRSQHILDIIKLSNARMAAKEQVSYNSDEETARLYQLAQVYGLVTLVTIDGRVCAGAICYSVGGNYFAHTLAHDPTYDDYRLGTLCCYQTICECIARGAGQLRFGGSTHRYKFDFMGVWLEFDSLTVYRSRLYYYLCSRHRMQTALRADIQRTKLWLLLAERRHSLMSRIAARLLLTFRHYKKSVHSIFEQRK